MKDKLFYDWLIEIEKYSKKSASDMVSRCRRVEKIYHIDLDNAVKTKEGFNLLRQKIRNKANIFIKPGSAYSSSISPIVVAVRNYHKFLIAQSR